MHDEFKKRLQNFCIQILHIIEYNLRWVIYKKHKLTSIQNLQKKHINIQQKL